MSRSVRVLLALWSAFALLGVSAVALTTSAYADTCIAGVVCTPVTTDTATPTVTVTPTTTPVPTPHDGDYCERHPGVCGGGDGNHQCGFNGGFSNSRCGNNDPCANNGFHNICNICNNVNCQGPPTAIRIAPGDCKVLVNDQNGYYNGYQGAVRGWNDDIGRYRGLSSLSQLQRLELTQRRNAYLRYQGLWNSGQRQLTEVCNNQNATPPIIEYVPLPAPPAYQAPPPPVPATAPSSSAPPPQVDHVPSGSVETGDGIGVN